MKIHYRKNDESQIHSCGIGNPTQVIVTLDLSNVTCKHCLRSATKKTRSGGRPIEGKRAKVNVKVRIDPELKERGKSVKANFSTLLEDALRQFLST